MRGTALNLLTSYLTNRMQQVTFNNSHSQLKLVKHGVPQGSVLGPVLFIIYTNDLPASINDNNINVVLYADDTTILKSSSTMYDALSKAENWFKANNLTLNKDKTQQVKFTLDKTTINNVKNIKFLGIYLSSSLNWSFHVQWVCDKLSRMVFAIRQIAEVASAEAAIAAYYGMFHSVMSYGIILWGNSPHACKIFILQKKVIRIICKVKHNEHCSPLFIKLGIMSLPSLYMYQCLIYAKTNINRFESHSDYHSYNTRAKNAICLPQRRLNMSQTAPDYIAKKLYNRLPESIKVLPQKIFKTKLNKFFKQNCFYSVDDFFKNNYTYFL